MHTRKLPALRQWKYLYLMMLPGLLYFLVFAYLPMYGITLAFKEFSYRYGIWGGEWVGLKYFRQMVQDLTFRDVLVNTFRISLGRILFEFPLPILLALLINEVGHRGYKRVLQTVFTFPHFISWVVAAGILVDILSDAGLLSQIAVALGAEKVNLLTRSRLFRPLLYASDAWKETGWGTIIYLATIAGVNPELYEAATTDGANRFRMMIHITWPALRSVMGIMLILTVAGSMNAGFDQIINLYNPVVYDVSDIIDTYLYRRTFIIGESFSSSAAIGLFKSIVNLALLFGANSVVKKINDQGMF